MVHFLKQGALKQVLAFPHRLGFGSWCSEQPLGCNPWPGLFHAGYGTDPEGHDALRRALLIPFPGSGGIRHGHISGVKSSVCLP